MRDPLLAPHVDDTHLALLAQAQRFTATAIEPHATAWEEAGDLIIARDEGLIGEDDIHAEIGEVIELRDDAGNVAHAVAVRVAEAAGVDLVARGRGGSVHPHHVSKGPIAGVVVAGTVTTTILLTRDTSGTIEVSGPIPGGAL